MLGKRLGSRMKDVADAVAKMGSEQIAEYEASGSIEVEYKAKGSSDVQHETLQAGEVQVIYSTPHNICCSALSHNIVPACGYSIIACMKEPCTWHCSGIMGGQAAGGHL